MKDIVFEKLTNVQMPRKAHATDAGIDFFIPCDLDYILKNGKNIDVALVKEDGIAKTAICIAPQESVLIPMGLKCKFEDGQALVFFNRSGIASKKHLFRGACIVDSSYRGEIFVNLTNVSNEKQYLFPCEKLIQAMLLPVPEVNITEGKVENDTERGEGGFGSTNNK